MITGCASKNNTEEAKSIAEIMHQQQIDWNQQNIEGFMQAYWQSDSLMFIGSNGITKGWEKTLHNYQRNYDSPEKMGNLKFTLLKTEITSRNTALVVGKWNLQRMNDSPEGWFTLHWKKINNQWKIVIDHTS